MSNPTVPPFSVSSLVEALHWRASEQAGNRAYTFLTNGEEEAESWTYQELHRRALAVALKLRELDLSGERAVLLYPPGLDFIAGFLGCLYARVVAVPAYPPRRNRTSDRLRSIVTDCQPAAVLTTAGIADRFHDPLQAKAELAGIPWVVTDGPGESGPGANGPGADEAEARGWPPVGPEDVAFLQYTSGSTSEPKGVVVRHGNLLHNEAMIRQAFGVTADSRIVGWLPLYHDMGLIGNVLQPLYTGAPCILMAPLSFLQRPRRWLEAITRYGGTVSGGPNFAYELCLDKIGPEDLAGLDLSSWKVAFNGAEPVRAATLRRFAERFAPCGFEERSFYPCYGLAEGTLFVTGGKPRAGATVEAFDEAALEDHRAVPSAEGRPLVSSGGAWLDQAVAVVHAASGRRAAEAEVGEIWISGPSVTAGYWRREEENRGAFGATVDGVGPFFRTGDLGFLRDGELYVTGRIKDMIIVRGRNLYPQDLEQTVEGAHRELRPGCCGAFSVEIDGAERLVVVQEVQRTFRDPVEVIAQAIRGRLAQEHEAQVYDVVLLRVGTLPRTSSGKIRRHACRSDYLQDRLTVVGRSRLAQGSAVAQEDWQGEEILTLEPRGRRSFLLGLILEQGSLVLGQEIRPETPLVALGLDSLGAVDLQVRLEERLGVAVDATDLLTDLLAGATAEGLADSLLRNLEEAEAAGPEIPVEGPEAGDHPASAGQRAFWLQTRLAPTSGALNIAAAARLEALDGPLDEVCLRRAWGELANRHGALRTTLKGRGDALIQVVHENLEPDGSAVDALEWSEEELRHRLVREAERPFDLEAGPLVRLRLYRRQTGDVLLLVLHHAVTDLWSQGLLLRQLGEIYDALRAGRELPPRTSVVRFSDVVRWQQRRLAGPRGEQLLDYWRRQLAGSLPLLDLATDRPRPAVRTFSGLRVQGSVAAEASMAAAALAEGSGTTLFMVLLAAFQALLHRLSGQQDLLLGSPAAGRVRPQLTQVVGYLVNMVVLRSRGGPGTPFRELLAQARETVLGALSHQEMPFANLAEAFREHQDPSRGPLFQAAFVLQGSLAPGEPSLGPFALGLEGSRWRTGALVLESRPLEVRSSQFELTLSATETQQGLGLSLLVNGDLYDATTAQRLLSSYRTLLEAALAAPEQGLATLPLLTEEEARQIRRWARPRSRMASAGTLPERIRQQAQRRPDAVAVAWDEGEMTYRELEARSNRLAWRLKELGVGPEARVGLFEERGPGLITGALGILKAGGVYVPLDPSWPRERLRSLVEDAQLTAVVTRDALRTALPEQLELGGQLGSTALVLTDLEADSLEPSSTAPLTAPASCASAANAAYLIYTSGSTGRPKGVLVPHHAVLRLLDATEPWFHFGEGDVWTLFHAFTFDFSVWEAWGPLTTGGRVEIVPYGVSRSPERFLALLRQRRVTVLNQTPSAFRQLLAVPGALAAAALPDLRWVVFGGEALDLSSLAPWFEAHGDERPRLVNMYGITETTVHVTYREIRRQDLEAGRGSVIGESIPDLGLALLDPRLRPVPIGVPGEIHVAGAGLARGYLRRPALTAQRFVPDPFAEAPGARLYRSGDLARRTGDGELEHLGRIDHQVKIRGFRIELGEIEAALAAVPEVREAVVLHLPGADGEGRLTAYLVPAPGAALEAQNLRHALLQSLPEYMVPTAFVELARLPLTENGKLDRKALPSPEEGLAAAASYAAPRNEIETTLAAVWASVLEVAEVGIDDNYFALGGDSIRSLRLQNLARERGLEIEFQDLFRLQTIRELASAVQTAATGRRRPEPFSLLSAADRRRLPAGLEDAYPLTRLMAGMVYQSDVTADYEIYVTSLFVAARLDLEVLRQSLAELAAGHEILRTAFDLAGFSEPLQLVHRRAEIPLAVIDLRAASLVEQGAQVRRWIERERRRRFAWEVCPLIRFTVHQRSEETFQLSMSEPFFDGWSVGSLLTELFRRYTARLEGRTLPATALTAAMRDFVALERAAIADPETRSYWRTKVDGAAVGTIHRWPRRGSGDPTAATQRQAVPIALETSRRLQGLADRLEVSLKAVLLAAHCRVLAQVTGTADVLTGLLWNGRPEIPDGDRILGAFLNALCFRLDTADATWEELVRRAFQVERELVPYRRFPLAEVQRERDGAPLFDSLFNYTHFHVYRQLDELPGVEVLDAFASDQTYFDLTAQFNMDHGSTDLRLFLDYRPGGFDAAQVRALGELYGRALTALAQTPAIPATAASLLSPSQRQRLTLDWSRGPEVAVPGPRTLHEAFAEQVAAGPQRLALVAGPQRWTFRDLEDNADRLAALLRAEGVAAGDRVALAVDRSLAAVAALLAVLKTGAAYVPLAATEPPARLQRLTADCGARLLLTDRAELPELGASCRALSLAAALARSQTLSPPPLSPPLSVSVSPRSLAWILYTSGSAGAPKGVMGAHGETVDRLRWFWRVAPPAAAEMCCQKSVLSSVDSILEVFGPLLAGVPAVLADEATAKDHEALLDLLAEHRVTRLALVPSLLTVLLGAGGGLGRRVPDLRLWISSGEALAAGVAREFRRQAPAAILWNLCGSTEASSAVTYTVPPNLDLDLDLDLDPGSPSVPVGRPRSGCQVYVLDSRLDLVLAAVPGQMCVGGEVMAQGYWRQPARTAERFVPDPFRQEPGGRLYRTGDLARWRPDGNLEILGRIDAQVQIRGFRVEPGEVEAALLQHPQVWRAAVRVWTEDGVPQLVAYTVPADAVPVHEGPAPAEAAPSPQQLRSFLRQRLPEHMIPSAFVTLAQLPLLAAGKVDRQALPRPQAEPQEAPEGFLAPRTPEEEVVAGIWADVLGRQRVGVDEDFYELGGHSLLATQIVSRLRLALGVELPLSQLFETPTVAGLAGSLDGHRGRPAPPPIEPMPRDEELPLSFAQQRLCFLDRLHPGDPVYNVPGAVELKGPLQVRALEAALAEVVRRHEALRTTFVTVGGVSRQRIAAQLAVPFSLVDLEGLPGHHRIAEGERLTGREGRRPFDLSAGPLVRTVLLRFGALEHRFLPTLHHVVSDGWSHGIFVRELTTLYDAFGRGQASPLEPLPVQYGDFAAWQRRWLQGENLNQLLDYWRRQLGPSVPVLKLPTDRSRPQVLSSAGSRVRVHFEAPLVESLRRLGQREGTSLFMTLLAGFEVVLHAACDQTDLVVGTDLANRGLAETERMIGFFVNQVVLRLDLGGDPSVRELLARVRKVALEAYAHQDLPFDRLVETLNPVREANRSPLFQVKFVLQNVPRAPLAAAGLELRRLELDDGTAKFDWLFNLWEQAEAVDGALEFRTQLFDRSTVEGFVEQYRSVLVAMAARPEATLRELRELLAAERRQRQAAEQEQWRRASLGRLQKRRPRPVAVSKES